MTIPKTFRAFRIHNDSQGHHAVVEQIGLDDLAAGDVVIRAEYSSVNYKDALAGSGKAPILRQYPLVGGIDVPGPVVASTDPAFPQGDPVFFPGCRHNGRAGGRE